MARRAGVTFEVQRLELEGDELVVSGFWSGVRGLRFVRPTLVSEDRRILATLEHKPWAPSFDTPWTAAFPWEGDAVDADSLALAVTPRVIVPLGAAPLSVPEPAPTPVTIAAAHPGQSAQLAAPAQPTAPAQPAQPEPLALETELEELVRERDFLRRRVDDRELLDVERERRAAGAAAAAHDELTRALVSAERERDNALAQLAEAVEAREAAIRTRTRMQAAHDEAEQARERAEAALAAAQAQRDEANSQRDEVLLAYRALQRRVYAERAHADRAGGTPQATPAAVEQGERAQPVDDELEEPLGVRTMPAARTVMAELQRPPVAPKVLLSKLDLWVIRVLGTVAAGCFIMLLVSIMRVLA